MTALFQFALIAIEQLQAMLLAAYPVLLRIGAAMALLPALGEASVPMRVRAALALALTVAVTPALGPEAAPPLSLRVIVTETVAGLCIGFLLRLFVQAFQIAGAIMAQSVALSHLFAAPGVEPSPVLSNLLVWAGLALFVLSGMHVEAVRLIVLSYRLFPAGEALAAGSFAAWGVANLAHVFGLALALAAPFVAVSLLFNLALGVINRAMPQLMVVFVGAPAITLLGLVLLAVTAPLILAHWGQDAAAALADPFGGRR